MKPQEEGLKDRTRGAFSESENAPLVFAEIIAPSVRAHVELLILVIAANDVADL